MRNYITIISFATTLFAISCGTETESPSDYIAFTGATIIDGSGGNPIIDGVLLTSNGRIVAVGSRQQIELPENTEVREVSGKTIIPGLINTHGHVGDVKGIHGGHYSKSNIADNLRIYARYGITTVVSLGGDRREAVPLRWISDTADTQRARLYIAGEVVNGDTRNQAVAVVDSNHRMGVDFMKIRVDDNLGSNRKMPDSVYKAVINRSHELGYQVAVHLYYLEDAKKLLEAGGDLIAHSVRDRLVDETFIEMMQKRNTCYCPTLTREVSTYVYEDTAAFFNDPFFTREYDWQTVVPLLDPQWQRDVRESRGAQTYKLQLPVAMANLKMLSDSDIPILMGTDSGMPTRFMGYFEHMEMEMMAESGLRPMDILLSATQHPVTCMELKGIGLLKKGNWADFVILDRNPLEDIRNTRSIREVWIGGKPVQL